MRYRIEARRVDPVWSHEPSDNGRHTAPREAVPQQ